MDRIKQYYHDVFGVEMGFTISLWILASAPAIWFDLLNGLYSTAALQAIQGFFAVSIVTLFCCLFSGKLRVILEWVFLVLAGINVCIDEFSYEIEHTCFTGDFAAIILGSNVAESTEFLDTFVTPKVVLFSICSILISIIIFLCKKYIYKISKKTEILVFICFILCCLLSFRDKDLLKSVYTFKTCLFLQYEKPKDLSIYRQIPEIDIENVQPKNVVVIFGESLSASHCSLYGYDKQTTPHIDSLCKEGKACFFYNVQSAAISTIPSFKRMLSTLTSSDNEKYWYSQLNIFDAARQGNYDISWISNQSASGIYDNIVTSYASLSDTLIWCGEKDKGMMKKDFDDIVLPEIKSLLALNKPDKQLWFIHLMGNHENFNQRYPGAFSVFSANDYLDKNENQRKSLSYYDNSVLYNDYIIDQIVSLFKDRESIVLYFSDHGLDIYESDPEYCGHARKNDPTSVIAGSCVPFIAYASDEYQSRFSEKWEKIRRASINSSNYNLENLMFTIMDLCNISLADSTEMGPSIFDLE